MDSPSACLTEAKYEEQCEFISSPSDLDTDGKRVIANNISVMMKRPIIANTGVSQWFDVWNLVSDHNGASPAIVAFGHMKEVMGCAGIRNLPVVLKCYINDVHWEFEEDILGMQYEGRVYACIVANMTSSPFFAFPYAVFSKSPVLTDPFERKLSKELQEIFSDESQRKGAKTRRYNPTCNYMIMEHCGTITLEQTVKWCDASTFIQLTLQMLSALKTMQTNKITHNDMHWGNVLIKDGSPIFYMDIQSGEVMHGDADGHYCARIDAGNLVKIFDWDAAVAHRLDTNPKTSSFGAQTNTFKKSFDTIAFLRVWRKVILFYIGRRYGENRSSNDECRSIFKHCFEQLEAEYPWAFKSGKGRFWQTVCRPVQGKYGKNPNFEDDCKDTWPEEMDLKFEKAISKFTLLIAQMLPASNLRGEFYAPSIY